MTYDFSGVIRLERNGSVELDAAYGLADRAHDVPMTTDTQLGMASGSKTFEKLLEKTASGTTITSDERVTSFPAVAGDIVFFTTTVLNALCSAPDARLYAFTFIGGPAYDNTGDNVVKGSDTPLVKTIAGQRATAPFIVDQHVVSRAEHLADCGQADRQVAVLRRL